MAFNIQADTGLLKEKNTRFKNIISEFENNVNNVMKNVNRVNEGWTGANSQTYVDIFTEYKKEMDKKTNALKQTTSNIDGIIRTIEEAREDRKGQISALRA